MIARGIPTPRSCYSLPHLCLVRYFHLDKSFVARYALATPPFGFNGLGELVYQRTYSRRKDDGHYEKWFETIERVVNGCYSLREEHFKKNDMNFDEVLLQEEAKTMYDSNIPLKAFYFECNYLETVFRMFEMKILPPGRGLWAMGSKITEERRLYAALNNCGFVSTKIRPGTSPIEPFCFLMDACMLGVGIGFDTRGAGQFKILKPTNIKESFVIPDSREGWVESVRVLLAAYFIENSVNVRFDYGSIRPKGLPVKGFGGMSSGPGPLMDLHDSLRKVLDENVNQPVSVRVIVDIMNLIGKAVISGNIRRSAEIAFGEATDEEYISLKDYEKNPERAQFGWTSNNSVFAKVGMNYNEVVDKIISNGEPGFAWLENMRRFGRMIDVENPLDNVELLGGNPCLEQTLHNYELCNLVEVFPAKHKDIEDFMKSLKFAFLYSKTVTLGEVHWPLSKQVMRKNRRIGCSLSGIQQFLSKNRNDKELLIDWCTKGYSFLKNFDKQVSKEFNIPESIKVTSIKPSGTVSLLAGATPGLHMPQSRFYIRRVRLSKDSALVNALKLRKYPIEDDVYDESSLVVSFPIDAGDNITTLENIDYNVEEQVSLATLLQKHWADNQVSCTVTFSLKNGKQHAKEEILKSLEIYDSQLKGISFLPLYDEGAYAQMPYESITEVQYLEMIKNIDNIQSTTKLDFQESDFDYGAGNFCDTDVCYQR